MVYSDILKSNLHNILPAPKGKNGNYNRTEKLKSKVEKAILENKEFCQMAIQKSGVEYINDILPKLVNFVINCNECYYYYQDK